MPDVEMESDLRYPTVFDENETGGFSFIFADMGTKGWFWESKMEKYFLSRVGRHTNHVEGLNSS